METAAAQQRKSLHTGSTPVIELEFCVDGIKRLLKLKLELHNPHGSLKDRIAVPLIDNVADRIDPEIGLIESTSGNLGVAMAAVCNQRDIPFNAIVDPRVSPVLVQRMRQLGAQIKVISEPDSMGGYLMSRIKYVHEQLESRPGLVWTNQYENEANPYAHFESTGPELCRQLPGPATILVPVSTGGTLAGLTWFARERGVPWRLIGVDVNGSAALGNSPGERLLSGIGSSRRSHFLDAAEVEAVHVSPAEAVSACLWVSDRAGVNIGGSSGATVAAALRVFRDAPDVDEIVCVCPDGGDRYQTTIYHSGWREAHDVADAGPVDSIEFLRARYVTAPEGGPHA
jgi:cysteine synthase A